MSVKYKVRIFQDDIYEVVKITTVTGNGISVYEDELDVVEEDSVYQGRLSDCESYIRLTDQGYM